MFGLMKLPFKESSDFPEAATLADLRVGCVVGFGFMPQKNISGRRLSVAEMNSYLFDADSFIVYRLSGENADMNMIVAEEEDPANTYLVLSQKIEPRLFDAAFPGHPPEDWCSLPEGTALQVRPPVLGSSVGWLATRYVVAMTTKGRFLTGDYRLHKPAERQQQSTSFDYVLLVNEDNEFALEMEKHENGTINVFATIYRSATDIGEISRPTKPGSARIKSIVDALAADTEMEEATESAETQPEENTAIKLEEEKPQALELEPVTAADAEVKAPEEKKLEIPVKEEEAVAPAAPEIIAAASEPALPKVETETVAAAVPAVEMKAESIVLEQEVDELLKPAKPAEVEQEPIESLLKPKVEKTEEPTEHLSLLKPKAEPEPEPSESLLKSQPEVLKEEASKEEAFVEDIFKPGAAEDGNIIDLRELVKTAELKEEAFAAAEHRRDELKSSESEKIMKETPVSVLPFEPMRKEEKAADADLSGEQAEHVPASLEEAKDSMPHTHPIAASLTHGEALSVEMKLAGRLIDEAQRNQILLSDLIRKVIDLPARKEEVLLIPFGLNETEVQELAQRYQVNGADMETIRQRIVEELQRFVGEKK